MKRFVSFIIMMAMFVGLLPAHAAGEQSRWAAVAEQCREQGLKVTWYPNSEGLMRRYGTNRMLLVEGGKSYLCPLNDSAKLAGPFDAFGEFNGAGLAPACHNGKWGMVDMDGRTAVDFIYDGQYEAEVAGENYPEFRGKDGKDAPPYALFTKDGGQITEYVYQAHDRFVNGYVMVTSGGTLFDGGYGGWGFIDANGYAVCEQKYRHTAPDWPKYSTTTATEYGVFDRDGFAIVCTDKGFNIIDDQGRELLDTPSPKRPWRAGDGAWGFVDAESGKVGFLDGKGQIVEEPQYDDPGTDPKGFQKIIYRANGAETEWLPHEGLRRFQTETDGLWGFWDGAGEKTVIPALFDAAGYFDHGYASVMVDGVFGLLKNPLGDETIAAFQAATGGNLDVTWVDTDHVLIPLSADQLIAERKLMGYSGPKVGTATPYYDFGLLDLAGRRLVPTIYGHTEYGGLIGGERFGFFTGKRSQDGNSVIYADILGNEFTYKDVGRMAEPDVLERYTIDLDAYSEHDDEFHDGLLKVRDKATGKWGAVDKTGKLVIPCQWGAMSRFGEGLSCVRETEDGKEGYINTDGELVMPCILDGYNAPNAWYEPDVLIAIEYQGRQGIWRNPTRKDKVSDWAVAEVNAATGAGYVTPQCSTYQTYNITREQFASLAVNYLEKKTRQAIAPAPADTFTDTADETVLKAYAAGIVQGMGDGTFGPGRPLSREQLAAMLWRAMEKVGAGMHIGSLDRYTDADQISDWAGNAMNNLVHHEIMAGTGPNTLSPKSSCTVEQAILLVWRAAGKEYTLPAEKEAQRQAAVDRATIEGLKIGTPFDQLPPELLSELQFQGETDDFAPFPGKEICKRYTAPGIEIVTSTALDQVAKNWFSQRGTDELLELFGTTDEQAALAQVLGREYVEAVTLTDDTFHMASGLKVGDSEERVKELGYALNGEGRYSEVVYSLGSTYIDLEGGKVARIQVHDSIGRRVGPFYDP